MFKTLLTGFMICFLLSSCEAKKQEAIIGEIAFENDDQIQPDLTLTDKLFPQNVLQEYSQITEFEPVPEEIMNLLKRMTPSPPAWASDEAIAKALIVRKVNFGHPGFEDDPYIDDYIVFTQKKNYLGNYEPGYDVCLYLFDEEFELRGGEFFPSVIELGDLHKRGDNLTLHIMDKIPGMHFGNIGAAVFDFNNDGKDELFSYQFERLGGRDNFRINIYGWDRTERDIVNYCAGWWSFSKESDIPFEIDYSNNITTPVEFTRYKNMNGFKVYDKFRPQILPVNVINDYYAWYFYTWEESYKRFTLVGEYLVDENGDEIELEYNIHEYSYGHIEARIANERLNPGEKLEFLEEINPNIEGGRSFNVTLSSAPHNDKFFERIYNFDSSGKRFFYGDEK